MTKLMNPYLLLALSIAAASANNYLLHRFSNRGLDGTSGVLLFNAACSGIWIVILGAAACISGSLSIDTGAALWGILYGGIMAAFLLCKMQAMSTGPVSLTAFVGNSSLLISTAFGVFVLKETATPIQIIGVALLIFALFLVASPKTTSAKKEWKLWCIAFFVCAAGTGIIFKLHQRSAYAENINGMMLCAAVASMLIFAFSAFISAKKEENNTEKGNDGNTKEKAKKLILPKSCLGYLIGCATVSCIYNRLNIFLAGEIPSVIFYPVFNGTVLLFSAVVGVAAFNEKLKKSQVIGIILGFAALVLASGTGDVLFELILR